MPLLLQILLPVYQELLWPAGGADVTPHQDRGTSKKSPCADKDRLSKKKKDGTLLLPWKPFCHRSEVVVFFATKHFLLSQEKSVIDPYDFSVCVVHESFFNVKHLYKIMLLPLSFFVVVNDFSARCRARPPVLFHSSLLACYLTLAQQLAGRKVVK